MKKIKHFFTRVIAYLKLFLELTILILAYLFFEVIKLLLKLLPAKFSSKFIAAAQKFYQRLVKLLDRPKNHSISRLSLIDLSVQNLLAKKSRTLITIGGMAVGIGSIVFLVSIGYGLQELVVSRVANLEELKQTDIIAQPNSELKINDETLSDFNNLTEVEQVLPLISVVGRITYKEAVADMAVYGVTSQYLEKSAIQPVKGKIFESDDLAKVIFEPQNGIGEIRVVSQGQVAGVATAKAEFGGEIQPVMIDLEADTWLRVRSGPSINSQILGYTKRPEGQLKGVEVWGGMYPDTPAGNAGQDEAGQNLGKWVKTSVYLWQTEGDEDYQPETGDQGELIQKQGYIAELGMVVVPQTIVKPAGAVLGVTDDADAADNTTNTPTVVNAGIDWVEIASESGQLEADQVQQIALGEKAKKQAVVNRAVLSVLGIKENQAIGEKFEASFIVMGKALDQKGEKLESVLTEYEIVGVIPGDKVPVFYVPFLDLRSLGIVNYSQVKLITVDQDVLPQARQKIEALGYMTRSVVDTVDQIKNIFATTRLILGLLGMAALLVATLGMFNTLTVSLLERTREVGLMKALGMKSDEVKELFLIESLIMGMLGGFLGIILGFVAGKLLSLVLSVFALVKGVGIIDITFIPLGFILVIVFLAILVGIVTGLYPAKRAKHISALNALRYE